jgi:hypothetical protein
LKGLGWMKSSILYYFRYGQYHSQHFTTPSRLPSSLRLCVNPFFLSIGPMRLPRILVDSPLRIPPNKPTYLRDGSARYALHENP